MFGADVKADNCDERAPALTEPASGVQAREALAAPSRYGEKRGFSLSAALVVVAMHAAAAGAVLLARPDLVRREEHRLAVVNVKLTPPPPPPAAAKPPKPQQTEVVELQQTPLAPPPPIQLAVPVPAPVVQPAAEFQPAASPPAPPAVPAPATPSTVQAGDLGARMLSGNPPRYPIECRRQREQGTVVLALVLNPDGRVQSIAIARSSGHRRLDEAARDAVRSWRWAPIVRDGQPVLVRGVVEIPFVLRDSGGDFRHGDRHRNRHDNRTGDETGAAKSRREIASAGR